MKKYLLIELAEGCELKCGVCRETCFIHPDILAKAKQAKEITNSIAKALQTHDGVKIYAVGD